MEINAQQRWESFINNLRVTYRNDRPKTQDLERSIIAFIQLRPIFGNMNATAIETINNIAARYTIIYEAPKALQITYNGQNIEGWFRQFHDLKRNLGVSNNRDYCNLCNKAHKIYGMEIEFNAVEREYRTVFLRKLNNKITVSPSRDDYGIDGSGSPLELRNINASTIDELCNELNGRITLFKENMNFFHQYFPRFDRSISTENCGIHIHLFHKGINLKKVLVAHTIAGILANANEKNKWTARMRNGYGSYFLHRPNVDWCRDTAFASELRMFNTLTVDNFKKAMEIQEQSMAKNFNAEDIMSSFDRLMPHHSTRVDPSSDKLHAIMALFIDKGAIDYSDAWNYMQWFKVHYQNFATIGNHPNTHEWNRRTLFTALRQLRPRPRRVALVTPNGQPINPNNGAPVEQIANVLESVQPNGRRWTWCERITHLKNNQSVWIATRLRTFKSNFNYHLQLCEHCQNDYSTNIATNGKSVKTKMEAGVTYVGIFPISENAIGERVIDRPISQIIQDHINSQNSTDSENSDGSN